MGRPPCRRAAHDASAHPMPCPPPIPAAVHPKTGRVCVPIDPARVREFDPFDVPTLGQLARQIDEYDKEHGAEVQGFRWHAHSLDTSSAGFDFSCHRPERSPSRHVGRVRRQRSSSRGHLSGVGVCLCHVLCKQRRRSTGIANSTSLLDGQAWCP